VVVVRMPTKLALFIALFSGGLDFSVSCISYEIFRLLEHHNIFEFTVTGFHNKFFLFFGLGDVHTHWSNLSLMKKD
jgi:hypothetical protein